MQIGFPTDVKHVAHIGWDGPSVSSPSWVNLIVLTEAIMELMLRMLFIGLCS
ncbi:hypothetical protein B296_00002190 [Ensete ventricosum]|uniref:CRIB domain-containing protein n=1 Tax=Ensete ventricosum TaxID=4639 RepID=A0A427A666_ENSVE|nr:hypothetical protein B296_00002190 [Ensete ventricosum]